MKWRRKTFHLMPASFNTKNCRTFSMFNFQNQICAQRRKLCFILKRNTQERKKYFIALLGAAARREKVQKTCRTLCYTALDSNCFMRYLAEKLRSIYNRKNWWWELLRTLKWEKKKWNFTIFPSFSNFYNFPNSLHVNLHLMKLEECSSWETFKNFDNRENFCSLQAEKNLSFNSKFFHKIQLNFSCNKP